MGASSQEQRNGILSLSTSRFHTCFPWHENTQGSNISWPSPCWPLGLNVSISEQNILILFACFIIVRGSPSIFFRNFPLSFLKPQDAREGGHSSLSLGSSLSREHFLPCSVLATVFNSRKEMAHSKQIPKCPCQAVLLLSYFMSLFPLEALPGQAGHGVLYQPALSLL